MQEFLATQFPTRGTFFSPFTASISHTHMHACISRDLPRGNFPKMTKYSKPTHTHTHTFQYKTLSVTNAVSPPFLFQEEEERHREIPLDSSADNDMRCRQNNMASLDFPSCLCQRDTPLFSDLRSKLQPTHLDRITLERG